MAIKVLQVCYSLKAAGIESFVSSVQNYCSSEKVINHFLLYKTTARDLFYKRQVENSGGVIVKADAEKSNGFLLKHLVRRIEYYKILKREQYDIVHVHASSGFQGIEVLIAHWAKVPTIIVHAHSSSLGASSRYNWMKKIIHHFGRRWINLYADVKLACSDLAAKWLFEDKYNEVILINNGIDTSNYIFSKAIRDRIRKSLEIPDDYLVVGHIGTFSEIKNHKFLIQVFKQCLARNPRSLLLLVGDGTLLPKMKEMVHREEIEDHVQFLGVRPNCNELLMAMDVFAFPSLWEGFPITVIEAQATGLNCVVSDTITRQVDITGCVAFISLNDSVSEWEDALIEAAQGQDELIRRNRNALVFNSGFDMANIAHKILLIYEFSSCQQAKK